MKYELKLGDCLEVLRGMPDNSVDSIVTDPPYGLGKEPDALKMLTDWIETGHHDVKGRGFMGKEWDAFVPQPQVWHECLRVLKPGGHLLAFAGTRTQDLMTLGLRLAGFEIRDMVAWVYGSGFPKSLDVSKALDKMAGAEREIIGTRTSAFGDAETSDTGDGRNLWCKPSTKEVPLTGGAATDAAKQWDGWGTALKPALEPITLARKPLEGTVAANVLKWHTGAINVSGCRVGTEKVVTTNGKGFKGSFEGGENNNGGAVHEGRWPANLIHDGSDEVVGLFPVTTSGSGDKHGRKKSTFCASTDWEAFKGTSSGGDSGSAARFFYCAKTSKTDRNEGLDDLPDAYMAASNQAQAQLKRGIIHEADSGVNTVKVAKNNHPTVKPTDLMRYLCRLVTPPGGVVLDPYMGSGSTGKAAMIENFQFIGIERDEKYFAICQERIHRAYVDSIDI
jgi:site-specific DNA-methyltransferase (adenine-specific)